MNILMLHDVSLVEGRKEGREERGRGRSEGTGHMTRWVKLGRDLWE